jgi:hypothetical protein
MKVLLGIGIGLLSAAAIALLASAIVRFLRWLNGLIL